MRKSLILMTLPTIAACTAATRTGEVATPGGLVAQEQVASAAATAPRISYPQTRRQDLIETHFGATVADPYRWLENDVRNDPEVRSWVTAQNQVTNAFLDALPGREALKARMTELYNFERFGVPRKKGGRYFYQKNDGLQNQSPLYVRESLNGAPRLLIDPNQWSKDGATALAEWVPSEDGKYLLYSVQDGGTDWRTVRVLDVATGKPTSDEIKWVKFSNLDWARDGSGFLYSRFDEPAAGQTFQGLNQNQKVYFHKLGTPQSADRLLFATPAKPELNHTAEVSDDGRWAVVTSSSGTDERFEVTLVDLKRPGAKPRVIVPGFQYNYSFIGNRGPQFYFIANEGAPKLKVISLDIREASPKPETVVAEQEATLDGVSLVGGKLIASYLVDAKTEVRVHNLDGKLARKIDLPGIGTAGRIRTSRRNACGRRCGPRRGRP